MSAVVLEQGLIHYETMGRGNEPLIFLHGWLGSWRYWVPAMEELSFSRRVYALDLWGFGDSDRLSDYTVAGYVDLLESFLNEMGIQRADLVGHALGGLVALRFAARSPNRVERVMGVSVPLVGGSIEPVFGELSANGELLAQLIARGANFPEVEREARKVDIHAVVSSVRSVVQSDGLRDMLLPFDLSVLLVHGASDPLVQVPRREWLGGFGQNTRVVLLEGVHHFPMLEERNKFNRLVMEFIDGGKELGSLEPKAEWRRRPR
ncbi:MAG: alpha/beta hydrolase [Chloroflexota bacterium]|nr:alpha/beta hydrolase [Chloroflexota bacterium]